MVHSIIPTLLLALVALFPLSAKAQTAAVVTQQTVELKGNQLVLSMNMDFSRLSMSKCHSVVFTPLITKGDSAAAFPSVVINGRQRHTLYRRLKRPETEQALTLEQAHQAPLAYQGAVACAPWMDGAQIVLVNDSCGCGWDQLAPTITQYLALWQAPSQTLSAEYPPCYVVPITREKTYTVEGRAYLDFPVNGTDILPTYRNNPRELAKIIQTIEAVRTDANATLTHIHIHGYASPEGSFAHNTHLANERAAALQRYVSQLMSLPNHLVSSQATAEDWATLQRYVKDSVGIKHRNEILQLIATESDPDLREAKIKRAFPADYRFMLQQWYPALRHSDYQVYYTVRQFTQTEAKELYLTHPEQLSSSELYQVAQSYPLDSPQYDEVLATAVRLYPNCPMANLNAANVALRKGELEQAERYLARTDTTSAAAIYAHGVLAAKQGDTTTARRLFTQALQGGVQQAQQALRLLPPTD